MIGWNRFGDEIYFVLARPNASPFQVPIWMTEPEAAAMTVRTLPRIDVAALRDLQTPVGRDSVIFRRSICDRSERRR